LQDDPSAQQIDSVDVGYGFVYDCPKDRQVQSVECLGRAPLVVVL
jgi:hypothetical protein